MKTITYRDVPQVVEALEIIAASYNMTKTELVRNYVQCGIINDLSRPGVGQEQIRLIAKSEKRRK